MKNCFMRNKSPKASLSSAAKAYVGCVLRLDCQLLPYDGQMVSNIHQMRRLQAAKTIAELGFLSFALFALALAVVMIALLNRESVWLYTLGWSACGGAFVCLLVYGSLELLLDNPDAGGALQETQLASRFPSSAR